jgi:hypothetical protein
MQVLQKRRMRAVLQAWFAAAARRRDKRLAMARAGRFWAKQQLGKAWNSWCGLWCRLIKHFLLMLLICMQLAWFPLTIHVCIKQELALLLTASYNSDLSKHSQLIEAYMAALAAVLICRVDHVETAARRRVLTQKVVARCKQLELTAAWNSWQEVVGGCAVAAMAGIVASGSGIGLLAADTVYSHAVVLAAKVRISRGIYC